MSSRNFALVSGTLFLVMTVGHLLRLLLGFDAVLAGWSIPTWLSVMAVVVFGYLAYSGLRLARTAP